MQLEIRECMLSRALRISIVDLLWQDFYLHASPICKSIDRISIHQAWKRKKKKSSDAVNKKSGACAIRTFILFCNLVYIVINKLGFAYFLTSKGHSRNLTMLRAVHLKLVVLLLLLLQNFYSIVVWFPRLIHYNRYDKNIRLAL